MTRLLLLLLCTVAAGCTQPTKSYSDYDRDFDFGEYRRFSWISKTPMVVAAGSTRTPSALTQRRIQDSIRRALESKGYSFVQRARNASFVVAFTVGARDKIDLRSYPVSYRGPSRWGTVYYSEQIRARAYEEGMLAIDIFDQAGGAPVWHGWTSKRITEADLEDIGKAIDEAVDAVLGGFPPP